VSRAPGALQFKGHQGGIAKPLPPIVQGNRQLLTDPDLGITIDEDNLKAQVGEPMRYRSRFDPDAGSVVDWQG
jgi:hypothetical protein